jgi:cytochrome c biogenesis protein CcmG/thiol:disulfide interchange protein DsbE
MRRRGRVLTFEEIVMSKTNKIIATIILIVLVAAGLYWVNRAWIKPALSARETAAPAGKYPQAPAFAVTDLSGQKLSLDSLRGKVVLLNFWATWCGPCRDEIPGFVQLQQKYGPQGFQIVGISMDDSAGPVGPFYRQFHMNYPVAMGNAKLGALYGGIYGLPTSFLIGRDGRIYDDVPGEVDRARWEEEIRNLLAQPAGSVARNFKPAGQSAPVAVETPAEANSEVPGVDLTKLSKTELAQFKDRLSQQKCTCGCSYSVLECRIKDTLCATSRDMAKAELEKMQKAHSNI